MKSSQKALESCFGGWLVGGCPCRPASNALSLTKRSDHGKRLPESHARLFYPSSGALTPVKEERESQAERGLLCGGRSDMTFHTGILHSDYWHLSYFKSRQTGLAHSMGFINGRRACWNCFRGLHQGILFKMILNKLSEKPTPRLWQKTLAYGHLYPSGWHDQNSVHHISTPATH